MKRLLFIAALLVPFPSHAAPDDTSGDALCSAYSSSLPEELRPDESELTIENALDSLNFLQREVIDKLYEAQNAGASRHVTDDSVAGISWEMLNIGTPNSIKRVRLVLLRMKAEQLAHRLQSSPDSESRKRLDAAVDAYCSQLTQSAYSD